MMDVMHVKPYRAKLEAQSKRIVEDSKRAQDELRSTIDKLQREVGR